MPKVVPLDRNVFNTPYAIEKSPLAGAAEPVLLEPRVVAPPKAIVCEARVKFPPPVKMETPVRTVMLPLGARSSRLRNIEGTPELAACTFSRFAPITIFPAAVDVVPLLLFS